MSGPHGIDHPGGAWALNDARRRVEPENPQPEFSPNYAVTLLVAALAEHGIETRVTDETMRTAVINAADLLRSLGVTPAKAPVLPKMPRKWDR